MWGSLALGGRGTTVGLLLASLLVACSDGPEPQFSHASDEWHLVFEDLPAALISVGGSSPDDVWVAGAHSDETGTTLLHFDGSSWQRIDVSGDVPDGTDLWWVHSLGPEHVLVAGSNGVVLEVDSDGTITSRPTGVDGTLFGVWGPSRDDLWAVGGSPAGAGGGVVLRSGGGAFEPVTGLPGPEVSSYFKVWGRSADEVRIVGADGVILEYDGDQFSFVETNTLDRLLTVHGSQDSFTAVGGLNQGLLLESREPGKWTNETPSGTRRLLGVWRAGERGFAVGGSGEVLARVDGEWVEEETNLDVLVDLHAVWEDPRGGVWAVGGSLTVPPLIEGTLVYRGSRVPSRSINE